jgi:hypothetical protein
MYRDTQFAIDNLFIITEVSAKAPEIRAELYTLIRNFLESINVEWSFQNAPNGLKIFTKTPVNLKSIIDPFSLKHHIRQKYGKTSAGNIACCI